MELPRCSLSTAAGPLVLGDLCASGPRCLASRCGDILTHIPCGNMPVWTYDCHQLVMPKWCQEKLPLSYSLSGFTAHDWFRDTPVFLCFGCSHNMLTGSWDDIMNHVTFHDRSSCVFTNLGFLQWPVYSCFPVAQSTSVTHLTYAWSLKAFYYKNLMLWEYRHFFSWFPNLWIDMMGFSL